MNNQIRLNKFQSVPTPIYISLIVDYVFSSKSSFLIFKPYWFQDDQLTRAYVKSACVKTRPRRYPNVNLNSISLYKGVFIEPLGDKFFCLIGSEHLTILCWTQWPCPHPCTNTNTGLNWPMTHGPYNNGHGFWFTRCINYVFPSYRATPIWKSQFLY